MPNMLERLPFPGARPDISLDILAIDPGTTNFGMSYLDVNEGHIDRYACGYLSGVGFLQDDVNDLVMNMGEWLAMFLLPPLEDLFIVIECPTARCMGPRCNPHVLRTFRQVIALQQALGLLKGGVGHIAIIDAYDWSSKGGKMRDDKHKSMIARIIFPELYSLSVRPKKTNNHERDAALLGYWFIHRITQDGEPFTEKRTLVNPFGTIKNPFSFG